jgi:hypothetical protein
MLVRNGERPATDCTVNGALKTSGTRNARTSKPNTNKSQDPIRAELFGSDTCHAEGITARSSSPVLGLCRKLIQAGHDLGRPLHAYRGITLCLVVRSIGEAAALEINAHGTAFVAFRPRRAGPPVGKNHLGDIRWPGHAATARGGP